MQQEPSLWQRLSAASGASLTSAIFTNPLDVIKTRMQALASGPNKAILTPDLCLCAQTNSGSLQYERTANYQNPEFCDPKTQQRSTLRTVQCLVKQEGFRVFFRGTYASMAIALPSMAIYLPLYESFNSTANSAGYGGMSPLIGGACARTIAVFCVAPVELLRTNIQGTSQAQSKSKQPISSSLSNFLHSPTSLVNRLRLNESQKKISRQKLIRQQVYRQVERIKSMYRGTAATLLRDVPFSALYFLILENIRVPILEYVQQEKRKSLDFEIDNLRSKIAQLQMLEKGAGQGLGAASERQWQYISQYQGQQYQDLQPSTQQYLTRKQQHLTEHQNQNPQQDQYHSEGSFDSHDSDRQDRISNNSNRRNNNSHDNSSTINSSDKAGNSNSFKAQSSNGNSNSNQNINKNNNNNDKNSDNIQNAQQGDQLHGHIQSQELNNFKYLQQDYQHQQESLQQQFGELWKTLQQKQKSINKEATPTIIQNMMVNILAGCVGGGAAAVVTHPFDVVKTNRQMATPENLPPRLIDNFKTLLAKNGVKSLFTGVFPRAIKAAYACALTISTYEVLKQLLVQKYGEKEDTEE